MKPKSIQRDIRSPNSRSSGQAPSIGRFSRLRDSELPYGSQPKRVRPRGSRRDGYGGNLAMRKLIFKWSVVLGAGALAVIFAAISLWVLPQVGRHADLAAGSMLDPESRVRVASRFPSPGEDEAIRLVKRAITNRNPANVGGLFHKGSASADEVVTFFKNSGTRDGAVDRIDWLSSMDADGLLLEGVHVTYNGKEKPGERLALLTPDDRGIWKLDFDAFARTVTPSWDDLLERGADHATVRVFVGRDSYFNGPFSDEKQWVCYGIASPDIDELLRGYCKVGSPEDSAMAKLLSDGAKSTRATLEIHRVKDADSRQFQITRVLTKDWVVPDRNLTAGDPNKNPSSF